jgi:hypothetical protein
MEIFLFGRVCMMKKHDDDDDDDDDNNTFFKKVESDRSTCGPELTYSLHGAESFLRS